MNSIPHHLYLYSCQWNTNSVWSLKLKRNMLAWIYHTDFVEVDVKIVLQIIDFIFFWFKLFKHFLKCFFVFFSNSINIFQSSSLKFSLNINITTKRSLISVKTKSWSYNNASEFYHICFTIDRFQSSFHPTCYTIEFAQFIPTC